MPSSLFADMDRSGSNQGDALDDQRALQIALDQLSLLGLDNDDGSLYDNEPRKKSVNMTECVPVPSSEHVAEIVGRQGCKIKALRAKTNTYIKTPVRGEEPVFVVTGRREDVAMARREIISAAEHFSMIRASRNKNISLNGAGTPAPGPPNLPGQTTIQVRVPYRVVGLVVGPKGATIKRIQQQTHTYIVTPSRDKEPIFEVTGMPENVDRAREEIEAHIAMRTGGLIELQDENDFHANGTDVGFDIHGHPFSNYRNDSSSSLGSASTDSYYGNGGSRMADYSPPSPALSYTASSAAVSPDCADLTFDSSPSFEATAPPPGLLWSQQSPPPHHGHHAGPPPTAEHPLARRVRSDPGGGPPLAFTYPAAPAALPPGPPHHHLSGSEVIAALVPCGHNLFCMECANRICQRNEPKCPVCQTCRPEKQLSVIELIVSQAHKQDNTGLIPRGLEREHEWHRPPPPPPTALSHASVAPARRPAEQQQASRADVSRLAPGYVLFRPARTGEAGS
ncbi:hypothetical protein NHX12_005755, partial [Muraenolepis orangiensis]